MNTNQVTGRTLIVQAGAYAEHHFETVEIDGAIEAVDGSDFIVHLAPGAGARLVISLERFVHPPVALFPWQR